MSDTIGSALWGIEFMFQVAEAGGQGVNFHTGDAKAYTPIGPGPNGHVARPLYYAMLMFNEAVRGASMLPAQLVAPGLNMAAYALRVADGTLKVCLINKDLERGARVGIESGTQLLVSLPPSTNSSCGGGKNRGHARRICSRRVRPLVSPTP